LQVVSNRLWPRPVECVVRLRYKIEAILRLVPALGGAAGTAQRGQSLGARLARIAGRQFAEDDGVDGKSGPFLQGRRKVRHTAPEVLHPDRRVGEGSISGALVSRAARAWRHGEGMASWPPRAAKTPGPDSRWISAFQFPWRTRRGVFFGVLSPVYSPALREQGSRQCSASFLMHILIASVVCTGSSQDEIGGHCAALDVFGLGIGAVHSCGGRARKQAAKRRTAMR